MRRVRVALATTVVTLAVVAPALPAAGAPAPAAPAAPGATAAAPGTIVQEGGPLTVPAGEEGPVTTRLTVTLPPGTTGPLREERLGFEVENGRPGSRPGQLVTSTCAVNGGAFAPCPWHSPDPETVEGIWLGFDLPRAEVPAGSSTVTYDVTVDTGSGMEWLGLLSTSVELRDQRGVVARGELAFRFVPGTPEAWRRSTLHARDRDGVLWQYDATGRTNTLLKPRKRVGGGWNVYTALAKLGPKDASGSGDMVARDRDGVLWYYEGSLRPNAPFEPRFRVGGGWNVYTALVGLPGGDLVARDRNGVLWRYHRSGGTTPVFAPPVRVGGGWNVYTALTAFGDGLVARTADGKQWRYEKADGARPAVPFKPRRPVGGGWNRYDALAGAGLIGDQEPSLAARTKNGDLLVYGTRRVDGGIEPYAPRPAGWSWNIYDLIV